MGHIGFPGTIKRFGPCWSYPITVGVYHPTFDPKNRSSMHMTDTILFLSKTKEEKA